jgi:Family of unknown function (DUF5522)
VPDRRDPLPHRLVAPGPDRLDPGRPDYRAILRAHAAALAAGDDTYPDPATGLSVLTAAYLWERGGCCGSGCRHCPWVRRADREREADREGVVPGSAGSA